jgi:hypothetical protein
MVVVFIHWTIKGEVSMPKQSEEFHTCIGCGGLFKAKDLSKDFSGNPGACKVCLHAYMIGGEYEVARRAELRRKMN